MLWRMLRELTEEYIIHVGHEYVEQAKIDYARMKSFGRWIKDNING